ncbi:DUF1883 domain-containing protein [Streptomyces sp. NPDC001536]|uniref:DUF1883 domain-containing protein n=1 Tax=Streptomyces sp. NPDC001536 TaxID=3364583 RepID=UPI0036BB270C
MGPPAPAGDPVEHVFKDLGNLRKGSTVVVTLRNQANVQVMTRSEYGNCKSGRRYRYLGGHVTRSPFEVTVPSNGHWVVAIDLGGRSGRIAASFAVQPPPRGFLPPAGGQQRNPARAVALHEPVEPVGDVLGGQTWDVFISHASEDKAAVARPLLQGPRSCHSRIVHDASAVPWRNPKVPRRSVRRSVKRRCTWCHPVQCSELGALGTPARHVRRAVAGSEPSEGLAAV